MKDKENSVQAKGADGAGLPVAPRSVHQQESAPELTPNPGSQGKQETPTQRVYKLYHVTMISFQDIRKCMFIFPLLKKNLKHTQCQLYTNKSFELGKQGLGRILATGLDLLIICWTGTHSSKYREKGFIIRHKSK